MSASTLLAPSSLPVTVSPSPLCETTPTLSIAAAQKRSARASAVCRLLHAPHRLGLDAPLVAVGWQCWWARWTGAPLGWPEHAVLFLAVWLIYLADRLADGAALSPDAIPHASARHRFAHRHRHPLLLLLVVIGATLAALACRSLNVGEFRAGLVLLTLETGYFISVHGRHARGPSRELSRWPWMKEAWVGVSFAFGSAFFTLCQSAQTEPWMIFFVSLFALLCFLNCALISQWETPATMRAAAGSSTLRRTCVVLLLVAVAGGFFLGQNIVLPLVLGAAGLRALDGNFAARRLTLETRRVLADVALLTPWLLLAAARWI